MNWDDQQRINAFGKLNTQRHELQAEIKAKKARSVNALRADTGLFSTLNCFLSVRPFVFASPASQKLIEDLEDAGNELMITDETEVRSAMHSVQQASKLAESF